MSKNQNGFLNIYGSFFNQLKEMFLINWFDCGKNRLREPNSMFCKEKLSLPTFIILSKVKS